MLDPHIGRSTSPVDLDNQQIQDTTGGLVLARYDQESRLHWSTSTPGVASNEDRGRHTSAGETLGVGTNRYERRGECRSKGNHRLNNQLIADPRPRSTIDSQHYTREICTGFKTPRTCKTDTYLNEARVIKRSEKSKKSSRIKITAEAEPHTKIESVVGEGGGINIDPNIPKPSNKEEQRGGDRGVADLHTRIESAVKEGVGIDTDPSVPKPSNKVNQRGGDRGVEWRLHRTQKSAKNTKERRKKRAGAAT